MGQYDGLVIKSGIPTIIGTDTLRGDRGAHAGLTTTGLASGDAVQVSGALTLQKAVNTSTSPVIGIYDGVTGSVVREGVVQATFSGSCPAAGSTVWLSSTAGQLTGTKPVYDNLHEVGVVVDAATGRILLQPKPVIVLPPTPPVYVWVGFNSGGAAKFAAADGAYVTRRVFGAECRSILYDGANTWTTDLSSLYKTLPDGSSGGDFAITVGAFQIAFDGTYLWVPAYWSNEIRKVNTAGGVVASYGGVHRRPTCALYAGSYVWAANADTMVDGSWISKIDPATGGVVVEHYIGYVSCCGITTDGTYVYVSYNDGINDGYVAQFRITDCAHMATWTTGAHGTWGCTFDGVNVWTNNRDSYNISKIRVADGTLFGPYAMNGSGWGESIAFDGTNIWATDRARSVIQKFTTSGVFIGEYGSVATIPGPWSLCTTYRVGAP